MNTLLNNNNENEDRKTFKEKSHLKAEDDNKRMYINFFFYNGTKFSRHLSKSYREKVRISHFSKFNKKTQMERN